MPLTLEQYATYLDSRDASWPAVPPIERPKARPHVTALPGLRGDLEHIRHLDRHKHR